MPKLVKFADINDLLPVECWYRKQAKEFNDSDVLLFDGDPSLAQLDLDHPLGISDEDRRENYSEWLSTASAHFDPENPSCLDELIATADALMYEEKRSKRHIKEDMA